MSFVGSSSFCYHGYADMCEPGPYYSCAVASSSARSTTPDAFWSSVPTSVTRARELMLQRAQASSYPLSVNINVLTISAWRTAGNKKVRIVSKCIACCPWAHALLF